MLKILLILIFSFSLSNAKIIFQNDFITVQKHKYHSSNRHYHFKTRHNRNRYSHNHYLKYYKPIINPYVYNFNDNTYIPKTISKFKSYSVCQPNYILVDLPLGGTHRIKTKSCTFYYANYQKKCVEQVSNIVQHHYGEVKYELTPKCIIINNAFDNRTYDYYELPYDYYEY